MTRTSRLILGFGYNSYGKFKAKVDNKNTHIYQTWIDMIKRCYGSKQKTYHDCSVDKCFQNFQDFAEWAINQIGFGLKDYHMDKDILCRDVKIYSKDTVLFIPKDLNMFLTNSKAARGEYPQGVSFKKSHGRYCAQIKKFKEVQHIGLFDNIDDAVNAYKLAKESAAKEWLEIIKRDDIIVDPRVITWLENYEYKEK